MMAAAGGGEDYFATTPTEENDYYEDADHHHAEENDEEDESLEGGGGGTTKEQSLGTKKTKNRREFVPSGSSSSSKISRLFRTISRAESKDSYATSIQAVISKLSNPEDRLYLSKSFQILSSTLADAFKGLATVSWSNPWGVTQLSRLLIEIYYALETEEGPGAGDRVPLWLIQVLINRAQNLAAEQQKFHLTHQTGRKPPRHLLLLHDTFNLLVSGINPSDVERIPGQLLNAMDALENVLPFKLLCTMFAHTLSITFANSSLRRVVGSSAAAGGDGWGDESSSATCFPDFVDVVIGWMVDEEAVEESSSFCSSFLHLLRPYFVSDPSFPKTLLKQILEDMEAETETKAEPPNNKDSTTTAPNIKRIMLLTKAYVAMLRVNCVEDKAFVNELSERVIAIGVWILETSFLQSSHGTGWRKRAAGEDNDPELAHQLLAVINQVLTLSPGVDGEATRSFVKTEIESLRNKKKGLKGVSKGPPWRWPHSMTTLVWEGICSWVEGALSATQLSEDTLTLAESLIDWVDEMEESRERVLLVQTLLRTRNVPLLQKVYAWHLAKLEKEGAQAVPFVLAGISDIAGNKSGSILTLYALQPSIFDLLISLARGEKEDLSRQQLVLQLLQVHCSIHSHWVASLGFNSASEYSSVSPGARFLPILLNFWEELLFSSDSHPLLTIKDRLWVVEWIYEFLSSSPAYASVLYGSNPSFFHAIFQFTCLSTPTGDAGPSSDELPELPSTTINKPSTSTSSPTASKQNKDEEDLTGRLQRSCRLEPHPKSIPQSSTPTEQYLKYHQQRSQLLLYSPPKKLGKKKRPSFTSAKGSCSTPNTAISTTNNNACKKEDDEQGGDKGDDKNDQKQEESSEHVTTWPYINSAKKLFKLLTHPDSTYFQVTELQSFLTTFCTSCLFPPAAGQESSSPPKFIVPLEIKVLLAKILRRLSPLVVLERSPATNGPAESHFLPNVNTEEEHLLDPEGECSMMEWTERRNNETPHRMRDYAAYLMPSEFNGILYALLLAPVPPSQSLDETTMNTTMNTTISSGDGSSDYNLSDSDSDSDEEDTASKFLHGEPSAICSINTSVEWDGGDLSPSGPSAFLVRASVDYLLRSKLRTVLGKPPELFTQLHTIFRMSGGSGSGSGGSGGSSRNNSGTGTELEVENNNSSFNSSSSSSCITVPEWKLDWLWLLEQGFILWGQGGSYFNQLELEEPIRQFFILNKTPCFEWLKRIRGEVVEAAFASGHFHHAYYHAAASDDWPKAELALFHLKDVDGLRGKEKGEKSVEAAARLYLEGNFQAALAALLDESSSLSPPPEGQSQDYNPRNYSNEELKIMVSSRARELLELDISSLIPSPEQNSCGSEDGIIYFRPPPSSSPSVLRFLLPKDTTKEAEGILNTSILDSQLHFLTRPSYSGSSRTSIKTSLDLSLASSLREEHNVWTLLKLGAVLSRLPSIPLEEKRSLWLLLGEGMLKCGNVEWVEKLLEGLGVQMDVFEGGDVLHGRNHLDGWYVPNPALHQHQGSDATLAVGRLTARLLLSKGLPLPASQLYAQLLLCQQQQQPGNESLLLFEPLSCSDLLQLPENAEDLEARVGLILEIGERLGRSHPNQMATLVEQMGWMEEQKEVGGVQQQQPLLQLLDKALELGPIHPNVWLALGNALYDLPEEEKQQQQPSGSSLGTLSPMKTKALESYANHLRFSPSGSSTASNSASSGDLSLVKVISRVITLSRLDGGLAFQSLACGDPSQLLYSPRWLDFLPELAITPALRPHILQRFPRMAAMFMWAHDSSSSRPGSMSVASLGRKGLFDPRSSILVDVNEEPYASPSTPILPLPPCCSSTTSSTGINCNNVSFSSPSPSPSRRRRHNSPPPSYFSSSSSSSPPTLPGGIHPYLARSPNLCSDERVNVLGRELLRLGTSSEELWSWTLQRVLGDWNRRISSLKKDMTRDPDPRKIAAYTAPIVTFLQEMWAATVSTSESPAQFSFVVRNCEAIPSLLTSIANSSSVEGVLKGFEKLLFHAETFDSFITYKSQLSQLSPKLANFKDWSESLTLLGMPSSVHILGIHPIVSALATKTKPKKIRFLASNGKSYEYLVKGNENLNVDAGMMQFFTLCQAWLQQPVWTYAVTPLGNRGGLIQMVEGATPVFQLYKKYLSKAPSSSAGEKTSEIFWKRMAAYGVPDRSRNSVDAFVLRQVFLSLVEDSPKDLISRELLLASPNVKHWFKAVKGFSRDSGLSAALGYLLGIGDRHLDNILVDVEAGKLVHVDFSLVFGRGEKLRVPEVVPFRLTPNFEEALAYPGIRGGFSAAMEATLSKSKGQEELVTFCARNIAFACQIEEDFVVNPTPLRVTEVNSAAIILQLRYGSMLKSIKAQRLDMITAAEDIANLDSSIQSTLDLVLLHESAVEQLTIGMSLLKNAQYDAALLRDLHSRIVLQSQEASSTDPSSVDALLAHLTSQLSHPRLEPTSWASSLEVLLSSSLQSHVKSKFDASTGATARRKERSEKVTALTRLINKWRRLLSNLDPLLTYIGMEVGCGSSGAESSYYYWASLKALIDEKWVGLGGVGHTWLHSPVDADLIQRLTVGKGMEGETEVVVVTLEEIGALLTAGWEKGGEGVKLRGEGLAEVNANVEYVQEAHVGALVAKLRDKVKGFNVTSSVELLVNEAKSEGNLSKMFEGWTPWI